MFDRCIYFNLSSLTRKITRIWQEEFSPLGLSPSHGYLLAAMAANPAASQKELSATMELDASTITRFIDALDRKKLIEKTSTGKGARFKLTPLGLKTSKRVGRLMEDLFGQMQNTFGKKDFKSFVDRLHQARQNLDPQSGN